MNVAIWIIAICEAVRIIQNAIQLLITAKNAKMYKKVSTENDWSKALQKIVDGEKRDEVRE